MTEQSSGQRRGRSIAMSAEEVDTFLLEERTCRVASIDRHGRPHNSPLWFVWDGRALWLNSLSGSQRWVNLTRNPAVSILVDAGEEYAELRGVELVGEVEPVGPVPRTVEAPIPPELTEPERLFGAKYMGGEFFVDGQHAWLRLVPEKVLSWDFRKRAQ